MGANSRTRAQDQSDSIAHIAREELQWTLVVGREVKMYAVGV